MSLQDKKDKKKNEGKKEKKDKSKKGYPKESNASSNDLSQEIKGGLEGSSPNKKSIFGMFKFGGRKSKTEKRVSPQGSSENLDRRNEESVEVGRNESNFSHDESSSVVSTLSTEVEEESEMTKSQSDSGSSSEINEGEAFVGNKSSEEEIGSSVRINLMENREIREPRTEETMSDDSLLRKENVNGKWAEEKLKEELVSFQGQVPLGMSAPETLECKLQPSVTPDEAETVEEVKEKHYLEQVKTEQDQEIIKSEQHSVDIVISNTGHGGANPEENKEAEIRIQSKKDQYQDEGDCGPAEDKGKLVSLETDQKKDIQIREQVEEFLKVDNSIEERSTSKSGAIKKDEELKQNSMTFTRDTFDECAKKLTHETRPFDESSPFIASTPKQESTERVQGNTSEDAEEKELLVAGAGNAQYNERSKVEFHRKVQILDNIKSIKMSTKALLAQLREVNKKLYKLQEELLHVQKSDEISEKSNKF